MKYKGLVIFLKGTEKRGVDIGKMVEIKITKVYPTYAFAKLI